MPSLEGFYQASDQGRIRSVDRQFVNRAGVTVSFRGKIRAQKLNRHGYMSVNIACAGVTTTPRVHQLVAAAFLGEKPLGLVVCHNDGVATNNSVGNLRYDTQSRNIKDKARHGTCHNSSKTQCPKGHPYSPENTYFGRYRNGVVSRNCRACTLDRQYRQRRAAANVTA